MLNNWLYHLLPGKCIFCGLHTKRNQDLCLACEQELPWQQFTHSICGQTTIALFKYQHPIDHAIISLKFNHKLIYAKILGELFANYLANYYKNISKPEIIIPVPLHKKRLQERGFNQATELAKPIAKKMHLPIVYDSCIRTKNTAPQSLIAAQERHKNVKNIFAIKKKITAKHVAIIDDVTTTGSTIKSFYNTLYKSGIIKIDIWCLTKT